MIPDNVIDKKLYERIKKKLKKRLDEEGKRWNAYTSGQLVQEYKRMGGKYRDTNDEKCLKRWFDEEWINVCEYNKGKIVPCGRKSADNLKNFPYCRPLIRVNKNSPKSVKELSTKERKSLCKEKRKSPLNKVFVDKQDSHKKKSPNKLSRKRSPNKISHKKKSPNKLSRKRSPNKRSPKKKSPNKLSRKRSPKKSSPKKSSPKKLKSPKKLVSRKGTPHPNRGNKSLRKILPKKLIKKSILMHKKSKKVKSKKLGKKVHFANKVIIKSKERIYKVSRKKWNHKYNME